MQTPIGQDAGALSNIGAHPQGAPPPLAVEHIAKSFFTADKITPVVGDLSFVLGKCERLSPLSDHRGAARPRS
jgi:hypothetical protein